MEDMAAAVKAHEEAEEEAETMEEDALSTVGDWELLFNEGDVDNVYTTISQVKVTFNLHDSIWTKNKNLGLFIQLGIDTVFPKGACKLE